MRICAGVLVVSALAVGCGSSERADAPEPPARGTLDALWRAQGEDVGLIQGTSDYAPGRVRVSFLVIRSDGRSVERPRARVWLARSRRQRPFLETTASLEPVGVPGTASDNDVKSLYVTHVRVPRAGKYWLLAEPVGGAPVQGLGTLVVKAKSASPPVGARAIPSRTPTIESTGGDLARLTTSTPPDRELLRHSIAESLAARKPFVVAFATPKFCASRTCGPTVDVVDRVRRDLAGRGVRFIHVEVYRGNDPELGVNRWMTEWGLPTEPWVFVVDRRGRIAAKFEGSVSVRELETAVQRVA